MVDIELQQLHDELDRRRIFYLTVQHRPVLWLVGDSGL